MNKELPPLEKVLEIIRKNALMPYEPSFDDTEIKEHYKVVEKNLKALEIIKEKVDSIDHLRCCIAIDQTLEHYNEIVSCNHGTPLTQEEYDLLKEVLK